MATYGLSISNFVNGTQSYNNSQLSSAIAQTTLYTVPSGRMAVALSIRASMSVTGASVTFSGSGANTAQWTDGGVSKNNLQLLTGSKAVGNYTFNFNQGTPTVNTSTTDTTYATIYPLILMPGDKITFQNGGTSGAGSASLSITWNIIEFA